MEIEFKDLCEDKQIELVDELASRVAKTLDENLYNEFLKNNSWGMLSEEFSELCFSAFKDYNISRLEWRHLSMDIDELKDGIEQSYKEWKELD